MTQLRIALADLILGRLAYIRNVSILSEDADICPANGGELHIRGSSQMGAR